MSWQVGATGCLQYIERGDVLEKDPGSLAGLQLLVMWKQPPCYKVQLVLAGPSGRAPAIMEKNIFVDKLLHCEQAVVQCVGDIGSFDTLLF